MSPRTDPGPVPAEPAADRGHDPAFPRLHGRPARGWVNDPNGCAHVDGRWHVFFQHNPAGPLHDAICWGHMSSSDLVRWRQEPIALAPRPDELDRFGCWSGCVLDDAGVPTAAYSAVADEGVRSVVLLARSDREMRTWRQERAPVAPLPEDPAITHARDPFVFELEGRRYAVQGAGHAERTGAARILVYDCEDLTSWTALGPLLTIEDPVAAEVAPANIWECPNLVRFGDRWVLIVSLWSSVAGRHVLGGVSYLVGKLSVERAGPRFTPSSGGPVDTGPCFYAPQVLRHDDRVLLWGWAREHGRARDAVVEAGWAGALTFCRDVALDGDALVFRPARELLGLRGPRLDVVPEAPFTASAFELELGADVEAASLWIVDAGQERLVADLGVTGGAARVLVDGSLVECFGAGPAPFTTRAYPTVESAWMLRCARPGSVAAWHLAA